MIRPSELDLQIAQEASGAAQRQDWRKSSDVTYIVVQRRFGCRQMKAVAFTVAFGGGCRRFYLGKNGLVYEGNPETGCELTILADYSEIGKRSMLREIMSL